MRPHIDRIIWHVNVFLLGMLAGLILSPARACATDVRLSLGAEMIHMQGYSLADLRVGETGGYGARVGLMKAPVWAGSVPDAIRAEKPQFDLQDISYWGVDREVCGERWCAALGAVRLSDTSWANGTQWNFLIEVRYQFTREWSAGIIHYSHGSMLGIAKDKSNRGWNFIGISYTWR